MESKYTLLSAFVAEFLRSGPNAKATPTNVYTLWLTGVPKKVYERPDLGIFFYGYSIYWVPKKAKIFRDFANGRIRKVLE